MRSLTSFQTGVKSEGHETDGWAALASYVERRYEEDERGNDDIDDEAMVLRAGDGAQDAQIEDVSLVLNFTRFLIE